MSGIHPGGILARILVSNPACVPGGDPVPLSTYPARPKLGMIQSPWKDLKGSQVIGSRMLLPTREVLYQHSKADTQT